MGDTSYANDYATGIEEVDTDALQDRADTFVLGIFTETGKAFEIDVIRDGHDYYCEVYGQVTTEAPLVVASLTEAIEYVEKVTA